MKFSLTAEDTKILTGHFWLTEHIVESYALHLLETFRGDGSALLPFHLCRRAVPDKPGWYFDHAAASYVEQKAELYGFLCNYEHWIFLKIYTKCGTVHVFDSRGPQNPDPDLQLGVATLAYTLQGHFEDDPSRPWTITYFPGVLTQNDGYNCGTYCLLQLEFDLSGTVPPFCVTLNDFRGRILSTLQNISAVQAGEIRTSDPPPFGDCDKEIEELKIDVNSKRNSVSVNKTDIGLAETISAKHFEENALELLRDLKSWEEVLSAMPFFCCNAGKVVCSTCEANGKKFTVKMHEKSDGFRQQRFYEAKRKIKEHLLKHHSKSSADVIDPDCMKNCRTIAQIMKLCDFLKLESGAIICSLCYGPGTSKGRFKIELNCDDLSAKLKDFSKIKKRLSEHLCSRSHQLRLQNDQGENLRIENYKAGMCVGNNAYYILRTTASFASIESKIQLDFNKYMSPGNINHSVSLMSWFSQLTAETLRDWLRQALASPLKSTGRLRPVGVVADKFSPSGDTFQMVGLITPYRGRLEYFYLGIFLVGDKTAGKPLALLLKDALEKFINIKEQFVGSSTDGQYHSLKVFPHFAKESGFSDDRRNFCSFTWDAAHLIELAASDSRGQHGNIATITKVWIKQVITLVSEMSRRYKWGKNKYLLQQASDGISSYDLFGDDLVGYTLKESKKPKSFKSYSATRFASHLYGFLESFLTNYNALCAIESADANLQEIRQASFVVRICFLTDFYKIIGDASKLVQKHDALPWRVHQYLDQLEEEMKILLLHLEKPMSSWSGTNLLSNTAGAVNEIQSFMTFRGITIKVLPTMPSPSQLKDPRFASLIELEVRNFKGVVSAFLESLRRRFHEQLFAYSLREKDAPFLLLIKPLLSVKMVRVRDPHVVPKELETVHNQFGQFLGWNCDFEVISTEYKDFQRLVHSIPDIESGEAETEFYMNLLDSDCTFPHVANFIASSVARTYCESIIEGSGSIAGRALRGREGLKNTTLDDILFTRINGPEVGNESQNLIESVMRRRFGPTQSWHFIRTSSRNLKQFDNSKVVDKHNRRTGKLTNPSNA